LSFDNAKVSDQFFRISHLPAGARYGITQTCGGIYQSKDVMLFMQSAWQTDKYCEMVPSLPLSKLKQEVDAYIKAAFDRDGHITVGDVFELLMTKGFMPCNLYAFLTGFLLKEYAVDTYRYSDGATGEKMSVGKLSEIIGEYIKHTNTPIFRYKEKFIEIQTHGQIAFAQFAKVVFDIPDDISVEQRVAHIRSKMKELGYPIWCLKKISTPDLDDFIDKLGTLVNTDNAGDTVAKIATTIEEMSLQIPTAANNLKALLYTSGNSGKAMREFLKDFENGDVLSFADEIGATDVLLDVKRLQNWLWDTATGEDEIRKLLTDYKIVAASNRINNVKTVSLFACLGEWREKAKAIKIPCTVLILEVPMLKTFFKILSDIVATGELPHDKRKSFLAELENNAEVFTGFLAVRMDIFKNVYSFHLTGFSSDEIEILYSKLPMTTFSAEKSDCENTVAAIAGNIRQVQEKYKLHQLWAEKTSSKTPKEWSNKHKTPILALVPVDLQTDARRVFDAINRNNPEESEVKFSLEFLQDKAAFLTNLTDNDKINEAFRRDIIGKFLVILPDIEEVRSRLEDVVPSEYSDWYGNPVVLREVEKFAQARYNQGGSDKVLEKIEKMNDSKAKDYLKRLVKDNINVGIEIISGGE
jgi:hypothetical protein